MASYTEIRPVPSTHPTLEFVLLRMDPRAQADIRSPAPQPPPWNTSWPPTLGVASHRSPSSTPVGADLMPLAVSLKCPHQSVHSALQSHDDCSVSLRGWRQTAQKSWPISVSETN